MCDHSVLIEIIQCKILLQSPSVQMNIEYMYYLKMAKEKTIFFQRLQ